MLNAAALKDLCSQWLGKQLREEAGGFSYTGLPPARSWFRSLTARKTLSQVLTYDRYDDETGLYHNLDSVGFALYCLPATGLKESDLKTLEQIFTNPYRAGTIIQVINIADPNCDHILDHWANARGKDPRIKHPEVYQALANRRAAFLKAGQWQGVHSGENLLVRDFHLILTVAVPLARGQEELSLTELDQLQRHRDSIVGAFKSASMLASVMGPEDLINIVGDILRPKLDPTERREYIPYDPAVPLREQFVSDESALYVNRDSLVCQWKGNITTVLSYSIKQFPNEWCGSANGEVLGPFFNRVQRFACPYITTMIVHVPDQVTAAGTAKRNYLRATQMKDTPIGKYVQQYKDRAADWGYVVKSIDKGSKLLHVSYQVMLLCPVGREEECEQSLKGIYSALGWRIVRNRFNVKMRFFSSLPLLVGREAYALLKRLKTTRTMLSCNAANLAPWIGEWKGNVPPGKAPILLLTGRRGQTMFLDPFLNDKGNFNIAVAATSGAGKSVFTQDYCEGIMGTGGRVFVIDSGGSYLNLCEILEGAYIDAGKGSKKCFNPFSTIIDGQTADGDDQPTTFMDQLTLLKQLIATMADPTNPLSAIQMGLLGSAIIDAWETKKTKATITTVAERLNATGDERAKEIAIMLRPYTVGGEYADFFEGEANIDFDNNFIVLELDGLNQKPDLQMVVLLILMKRITEAMYLSDRKQRKLCVIDEAWRLLSRGNAGEFIEEGYRTARKYGGAFMTITQGIDDYYKSPTATAAYNCSDFKFFLRQNPESLAQVKAKNYVVMNDYEERLYRSVTTEARRYSEVAIKSPDGLAVGLLILDPFNGKLKSTTAADVEAIKDFQKQGYNKMKAIEMVAAQ